MSDKTGIAWTNATWNPVTGCTKVSQGCKHCYAEREWGRLSANPKATTYYGREFTDIQCHPDRLTEGPIRWRKPRMIFVNSMSDLFHEKVPFEFIDEVFEVINCSPMHTFQILTKRPERMLEYFQRSEIAWAVDDGPLDNVWLGVSVEDQVTADERIPLLLQTPAAVRWVSAEPLLNKIDLTHLELDPFNYYNALTGDTIMLDRTIIPMENTLSWVVAGGESGNAARALDARFLYALVSQCKDAGTPIFVKQLGYRFMDLDNAFYGAGIQTVDGKAKMVNRAGADLNEWPDGLRVREWPVALNKVSV
ncbi:MAG: phage Gp37/Gp68 family protein [Acidithiobacillus sp.]|nr:phage Gp37/Gp68 family protein [Acidithiobacillus sp.]